ncbi:rod-binding protein [Jannaschia pohangensis]|uniref:Rod binding protein n=1 Tax=Jannaschia pohangensis TaxID=390807 RepID=A0A1I3NTG5_9RHOB|nr:rod-binding protein [Jannaschia pohangensis]SFJ12565.1 Rod binding protein [Jannaschia pohangensis]
MIATPLAPAPWQLTPSPDARDRVLRDQAQQLEAFLFAELLRVSGTGTPSPGGGGETQFDSFLRQSQAEAVAASGQTGLAEAIYRSLADRQAATPIGQEQL